jgi:hypothetical protein
MPARNQTEKSSCAESKEEDGSAKEPLQKKKRKAEEMDSRCHPAPGVDPVEWQAEQEKRLQETKDAAEIQQFIERILSLKLRWSNNSCWIDAQIVVLYSLCLHNRTFFLPRHRPVHRASQERDTQRRCQSHEPSPIDENHLSEKPTGFQKRRDGQCRVDA